MSNAQEFLIEGEKRSDAALHEPILNNAAADVALAKAAVARAVGSGLSKDKALALYGHRYAANQD